MIEGDRVLLARREKGPAYKQALAAGKGCVEKKYYVLRPTKLLWVGKGDFSHLKIEQGNRLQEI